MRIGRLFVRPLAALVLSLELAGGLLPIARPLTAFAATDSPLTAAISAYREGEFAECVRLLSSALAMGKIPDPERASALEYIARAHVRLGNESGAIEAFGKLLAANPLWRPDPDRIPPAEAAVFEKALALRPPTVGSQGSTTTSKPAADRDTVATTTLLRAGVMVTPGSSVVTSIPRRKSKLMWIVGGAVAAGVGIAVAAGGGGGGGSNGGGGGGPSSLPGAPAPPSRP